MCEHCGCGATAEKKVTDLEEFRTKVSGIIEQIRPGLQMDGGDIKLIDVEPDGTVKVQLQGACSGCPHAATTLKMGVEQVLKEHVPEVACVENVEM